MELICATCHRRWTLERRQKRTSSCPRCRHRSFSSAMVKAWDRRKRLEAPPVALPDAGPFSLDSLAELMRAADAASEKALKAARDIAGGFDDQVGKRR